MNRTPGAESLPLNEPSNSCINQKLRNPCQWQTNRTSTEPNDEIYRPLKIMAKMVSGPEPVTKINNYIKARWDSNYETLDDLHSEWSNVLIDAKKKPLPDPNIAIDDLLIDSNLRLQKSMIAFENFRRTRYPNNEAPPDVFEFLQNQIVCLLCELRTCMQMRNIEAEVMEHVPVNTDYYYKLHEYIELKTFLSEIKFLSDRIEQFPESGL